MDIFYSIIAIPLLALAASASFFQWVGYSIVEASGYPFDDQFEIASPSDVFIVDSNHYVYQTDGDDNLTCFYLNEYKGTRKYLHTMNIRAGETVSVIGQSREVTPSGFLNYELNDVMVLEDGNSGTLTIKFSNHHSNLDLSREEKLSSLHICEDIDINLNG